MSTWIILLTSSAVFPVVAGSSAVALVAIRAKPHTHAGVLAWVVATGIHCRQVYESRRSSQLLNNRDSLQFQQQQQLPRFPHTGVKFILSKLTACGGSAANHHLISRTHFFFSLKRLPVPYSSAVLKDNETPQRFSSSRAKNKRPDKERPGVQLHGCFLK